MVSSSGAPRARAGGSIVVDTDRRPAPERGKGSHVNSHRLPRTVVPSRYDIRLEPDLDSATYAGEEIVQVEVRDETDEVQLNAVELTITTWWPRARTGPGSRARRRSTRRRTDRVHLRFPARSSPESGASASPSRAS